MRAFADYLEKDFADLLVKDIADHLEKDIADHLERDFADLQGSYHWLGDKVEGCILWWLLWVSGDAHQNQIEHTADQILQFPGCHDR